MSASELVGAYRHRPDDPKVGGIPKATRLSVDELVDEVRTASIRSAATYRFVLRRGSTTRATRGVSVVGARASLRERGLL